MANHPRYWHRAIILVDMDAFFAGIEQQDHPEWRGKPVAVTNGLQGSCVITCSYEARRYGIKTGMRLKEAHARCGALIQVASRPERYTQVSTQIMAALQDITPDIEVFSVDEAFLDVTHCQKLWGSPELMAQMTKDKVFAASGLSCSVGLSSDKTTAKYAAKLQKPNGLTIIPPWETETRLRNVPVTELCGIAQGISRFLARYGAVTCGDVVKLPVSLLAQRFGNPGRRIWYMCKGADPEPLLQIPTAPKSMGHGKVMPPNTTRQDVILTYLLHMCEKLGSRLRRHDMQAQQFFIGLRSLDIGWLGGKACLLTASNDSYTIYCLAKSIMEQTWQGQGISQVQVTALDPKPACLQLDLFLQHDPRQQALHQAQDTINQRFGQLTLAPARLLNRSSMPNVIAPAWKPYGHRQTI